MTDGVTLADLRRLSGRATPGAWHEAFGSVRAGPARVLEATGAGSTFDPDFAAACVNFVRGLLAEEDARAARAAEFVPPYQHYLSSYHFHSAGAGAPGVAGETG